MPVRLDALKSATYIHTYVLNSYRRYVVCVCMFHHLQYTPCTVGTYIRSYVCTHMSEAGCYITPHITRAHHTTHINWAVCTLCLVWILSGAVVGLWLGVEWCDVFSHMLD